MLSDRDIKNWDQRLRDQAGKGWDNYSVKRIDLSQARINHPVRVPGEFLCVVEIKSIFTILFISNEALVDQWIDLTIGINFEYKKKIIECGLTKTGQVTQYQAGDDGTYEAGWVKGRLNANNRTRFSAKTIGGDDVVLDRATGLMWAADGNEAGCNNGALIIWGPAITYAEALNFAGFTDWRLPNIKELFSIVDVVAGPPLIADFFTNTVNARHWSSTTNAAVVLNAFMVDFSSGTVINHIAKTADDYIRCVRSGL